MAGGLRPQAYVHNPMEWVDPLGLVSLDSGGFSVYALYENGAEAPYYIGISNDPIRRLEEHVKTGRFDSKSATQEILQQDITYAEARGYEQAYIEKYETKTGIIGQDISSENKGNKANSFDKSRTDARGKAFNNEYEKAKIEINQVKPNKGC